MYKIARRNGIIHLWDEYGYTTFTTNMALDIYLHTKRVMEALGLKKIGEQHV